MFKDGIMIGATVEEVVEYLKGLGIQVFVEEETEDECGVISTDEHYYSDHYEFEIENGIVVDSYAVEWEE